MHTVNNFNELQQAIQDKVKEIVISRSFLCNTSITLPPSVSLLGQAQENGTLPSLSFVHTDGVGLTQNNTVSNLVIQAPVDKKAIYNTSVVEDLGTFKFNHLKLTGQFSIITRSGVKKTRVTVKDLDIVAADARHYLEQPQKYGVNVLQGAFTVYNFNSDAESLVELEVDGIRIGRPDAPVVGSGLFVSGFGDEGGKLFAKSITTDAVYSNGKIPFGVANLITAGVFVVYGAKVEKLTHNEDIVTYGVNDMVLDTWGEVDYWLSKKNVISYGPSGVGFVNFGYVKHFEVLGNVETYGLGARGYNQYDGTVDNIVFKSIKTFGDGSVGIQISKKIGQLTVNEDVTTYGGIGNSLVKGKNVLLPAIALSIKEGGDVESITIGGNVETHGDNVTSYQVDAGIIRHLTIKGQVKAHGKDSKDIAVINNGQSPLV